MKQSPDLAAVREALGHLMVSIANGMMALRRTNSSHCVYVHYETSDGWHLVVFNDCGCWDYLAAAVSPTGVRLDNEEIQGIQGIDWNQVRELGCWGHLHNYAEWDEEYPDQDPEEHWNSG